MSSIPAEGLTIGAVAARTGVSVPVLRAWEQRYGFPRPERLPGGHRRYDDAEVERILYVLAERAAGRSLESAIAALAASPPSVEGSATIFAGLRRLRPDLPVHLLGRRTMLAISLAIEDECCARADRPHLAAAFQRAAVYRDAQPRWEELATTAASTIVFAGFDRSRTTRSGVREVAISASAPLRREWSVVCDAPESAAVLAGWERQDGRFEAVWSVEPEVVRAATHAARSLATRLAPRLRLPDPPAAELPLAASADALQRATALTARIVAYLDALPASAAINGRRPSTRGGRAW